MRRNRLFLVFTVLLVSLMALSAVPALADDGVQAANLTDVSGATGDTSPADVGDGAGQIIAGGVTTFSVRANFVAAYPGLPFEDFESTLCTGILGFPAPLSSSAPGPCYTAGQIEAGLELRDNPLNGESPNGLVFAPAGTLGLPNDWVGANTFTNSLEIYFTPTVQAAGLDVASVTSATPLRIRVYGPGNSLSYETTYASVGPTGAFFGVNDPSGIAKIELLANNGGTGNGAEGLLGILFGNTGGGGDGITLEKTVGTNPNACAATDTITVNAGTDVTYCYNVTNNTDITLSLHNLEDSELGTVLSNFPYELGPGDSVFVTETETIVTDTTNTATWTAFNPISYSVITGTCTFPEISGTGTPLNLGDDGTADVTMPFNFQLYDVSSNIATVSNNGVVSIGQPGLVAPFTNEAIPSANIPTSVAAFWDDLIPVVGTANQYVGTYVYTVPDGNSLTNPNGNMQGSTTYYVIEWKDLDHFPSSASPVTFAAGLLAPGQGLDGYVFTCYQDINFGDPALDFGASATIGLNQDATNGNQYSFNTPRPALNGNGIGFLPVGGGESYTATDSATVNTVAPDITVTPANIAETHATPPQSTNRTLTIGNVGDAPLTWTIYEDSTRPTVPTVSRTVAPIAPDTAHSTGRAPVTKDNRFHTPSNTPIVNLGGAVPANGYRFTFDGTDIVSWADINSPANITSVAATARSLFAGDFVGGDFTKLYVIDSDTNQFLTVSTSTGAETVLGTSTPAGGESWSGLSYDATNNTLYGSATSCASSTLYTINQSNGTATAVGSVSNAGCLIDIAVSPTGQMYGVDIVADTTVAINKTTGAGTVIGSTGIDANFAQGMDFDDASGILYYAAFNNGAFNGELRTINLTTGASTLIGPFGADTTEIDSFAIATGGTPRCDGPDDISWLTLSTTGGTTAPGGSSNVTVTFNSASLANGVYTGTLCVESNDFDELLTRVPVTLTVGGPTAISLSDMNMGAGGLPMVAFAAAGGLLLAAAGLLLRKRDE